MRAHAWSALAVLPLLLGGCSSGTGGRSGSPREAASSAVPPGAEPIARPLEPRAEHAPSPHGTGAVLTTVPGAAVQLKPVPAAARERARVDALVASARDVDAAGLLARHAVPFRPYPGAKGTVVGLDLLQRSALELTPEELAALRAHGFVVTRRQPFPSFLYGYQAIYGQDLPVYVSADSILNAVHRSFDEVLALVETEVIAVELRSLLERMRVALQDQRAAGFGPQAVADADLYLAVALGLLEVDGTSQRPPIAGADPKEVARLVRLARNAGPAEQVELFGARRLVDFSQFRPRGHYERGEDRQAYFRTMMWLGRLELRLVETVADGSRVFHRRQLEGALALRALLDDEGRGLLSRIDRRLEVLVGERDDLAVEHLDALAKRLGLDAPGALGRATDAALAAEIFRLNEGLGRVAGQIILKDDPGAATLPPCASFLLLGQRRTPDAEVLSNVVFDRAGGGLVQRLMPDPLDVAFATLGNDQAAALLAPELERYPYAPDLARMRVLVDDAAASEPAEARSLREAWLLALRELSPSPAAPGLPLVARSEVWGRRLLSTQLASWAELRHDTVLYDKPSYSSGELCDYPDGYVEPYPEFYAALRRWAALADAALQGAKQEDDRPFLKNVFAWLTRLDASLATLEELARLERAGRPFRPEHLAFLNRSIHVRPPGRMCGALPEPRGWFADMYFVPDEAVEFAPVVSDVHTQPTVGGGATVGRVLHVATGAPRLLAVIVDTTTGPHVYVGLASAYHERITERFQRLTDDTWAEAYWTSPPADPAWTNAFLVGAFEAPDAWRSTPGASGPTDDRR